MRDCQKLEANHGKSKFDCRIKSFQTLPCIFNINVFSSTTLRELGFKVADNLETIEVSKFPGEICNRNFEVFE